MALAEKRISIILASYNDARIAEAIKSVRLFDDCNTVRLVIIDGASRPEVVDIIRENILPGDYFVTEKDDGVFDALNKGLAACKTEYIGWLGADDRFTGRVKASEVVGVLADYDLYVANVAMFREGRVRRVTFAYPSSVGLDRLGLHNPHYATFGRAELLKNETFRLDILGSDIDYFLRVFGKRPRILSKNVVATLMLEGGFSSANPKKILQINAQLYSVYSAFGNPLTAAVAVALKFSSKVLSVIYYSVVSVKCKALEITT